MSKMYCGKLQIGIVSFVLTGACFLYVLNVSGEYTREINPYGKCSQLKCETKDLNNVTLRYMSGHTIENHTITTNRSSHSQVEGDESACVKKCIAIPSCITIVVGKNEGRCWLYEGDDVYVNLETVQPKQGYKIISLGNGVCKYQPCKNGKCVPNFDGSGQFTCACDVGYTGDRCEISGADLHFTFDKDTTHPNTRMGDLQMELTQGRLIQVPDRRGKVLLVREGQKAVHMSMKKSLEYGEWMSNPWFKNKNLTVTFWLKMDPAVVTDEWRKTVQLSRWYLAYNGHQKLLKAFISSDGDRDGTSGNMNVECRIERIQKWKHIVLAMSGESKVVKLYVDGDLCDLKDVSSVMADGAWDWSATDWPKLLFEDNKGISMIDELKFYNSFPQSDDTIRQKYLKEERDYMS